MVTLNSIMIGTSNPKALAEFYEKALGKAANSMEGNWYNWEFGTLYFSIGEHSEVKGKAKEPERIIWNLETKDVKGEFERIKAIGATVIKEPYEMGGGWIATFADPDGNYFQLVTPWDMGK